MTSPLETLLAELASSIPELPNAACRGRHQLFDPPGDGVPRDHRDEQARRQHAIDTCNSCPALAACAAWVESLPRRHRPVGVVAGRVIAPPAAQAPRRPRPPAPPRPKRITKLDRATTWLAQHLTDRGGISDSATVTAAANAAGHHRATVHLAAQRLGVVITKTVHTRYAPTQWALPEKENTA